MSGEIDRLTYALAVMEAKYEGQKRRAAAEAASVLEMKRNFVRGVSHEIRTPLNVSLLLTVYLLVTSCISSFDISAADRRVGS